MLAAHLTTFGGPLTVREAVVPTPGRGEVLIRVAAAAINPSDLRMLAVPTDDRVLPIVPGLEGSGTVVAAGPGLLPRLLIGRRVAFAQRGGGAWAEYAVSAAGRCVPLGREVSFEQAAALIVNPLTALALIDIARRGRHRAIVSTAAAGAVGQMVMRLAKSRGISVINIVRRPGQVAMLRSLGAEHVLDSSTGDFVPELHALTRQLQARLAFDAVGGPIFQAVLSALPQGGTVTVYGALAEVPSTFDSRHVATQDKRVDGFYLGTHAARRSLFATIGDIVRVQRLIDTDLRTTVRRRMPLAAVQDAVEWYRREMTAGKVLLISGGGPE